MHLRFWEALFRRSEERRHQNNVPDESGVNDENFLYSAYGLLLMPTRGSKTGKAMDSIVTLTVLPVWISTSDASRTNDRDRVAHTFPEWQNKPG